RGSFGACRAGSRRMGSGKSSGKPSPGGSRSSRTAVSFWPAAARQVVSTFSGFMTAPPLRSGRAACRPPVPPRGRRRAGRPSQAAPPRLAEIADAPVRPRRVVHVIAIRGAPRGAIGSRLGLFRKRLPQLGHRGPHPRLHRPDRDAPHLGDLLVGEETVLAEEEDLLFL